MEYTQTIAYGFDMPSIGISPYMLAAITAVTISLSLVTVICMWKIFEKTGTPGWFCLIPGLNIFKLFEISCGNGWKMFFLLIPVFGQIYYFIMLHKLSRAFGYGILLTILQVPAPVVALFILAFGNNDYYGAY